LLKPAYAAAVKALTVDKKDELERLTAVFRGFLTEYRVLTAEELQLVDLHQLLTPPRIGRAQAGAGGKSQVMDVVLDASGCMKAYRTGEPPTGLSLFLTACQTTDLVSITHEMVFALAQLSEGTQCTLLSKLIPPPVALAVVSAPTAAASPSAPSLGVVVDKELIVVEGQPAVFHATLVLLSEDSFVQYRVYEQLCFGLFQRSTLCSMHAGAGLAEQELDGGSDGEPEGE